MDWLAVDDTCYYEYTVRSSIDHMYRYSWYVFVQHSPSVVFVCWGLHLMYASVVILRLDSGSTINTSRSSTLTIHIDNSTRMESMEKITGKEY